MRSTIIGGAMLPHAPQFFTQPDSEPKETIRSVQEVASRIGRELADLKPDLWIIVANDHAQQFFHQCAPPFTLHVGQQASGHFAGRDFHHQVPSDVSFALIRELYEQGFDPAFTSVAEIDYAMGIPLTHLNVTGPVLPVYINAYLPPQPTMQRCYQFGVALASAVSRLGLRTAVIASGGMSHFPGTDRYSNPDLDFDEAVLSRLRKGHLKSLIGYGAPELDDTGNIELRCWAVAAGMLGDRRPDIAQMDPSWHHNYASLGFYSDAQASPEPHYPTIAPALVGITSALHKLAYDHDARNRYLEDPHAYASQYALAGPLHDALVKLDPPALAEQGVHPLIGFLADMHVRRARDERKAGPKE